MSDGKKFELVRNDTKDFLGKILYRIKALKDFSIFKKGELGGYVECEKNLSHENNAWVFGDARVYGNARVSGNACVYGNAWVYGNARVFGDACVYGNALVFGDACVFGDARVFGDAWVYGNALVFGDACVFGDARVYGDVYVYGKVKVDFVLCSKFSFESQAQLNKWLELEREFEKVKDSLKDKPKVLEDLTKEELIEKIKDLEAKG